MKNICSRPFRIENLGTQIQGICLFEWNHHLGPLMTTLVRGMKNGRPRRALQFYGDLLVQQRVRLGDEVPQEALVIPCPGRGLEEEDHAMVLAKCLAVGMGLDLVSPLIRLDQQEQKGKSKSDRRLRRLKIRENFSSDVLRNRPIIFVDDVVTTGSTALSAYLSLGRPKKFEILSLCYRPILAEG